MKTTLYNLKNEVVGEVDLPPRIFGVSWKPVLVNQVLLAQMANRRHPWAHAKTRAEVRGGGRKPWRQKGTGRARHGSIRSPIWIGGGKAHGPLKERDYSQKVNKKMKQGALFSLLSRKLSQGALKIFDTLHIDEPKTKNVFAALPSIIPLKKGSKRFDVLFIPDPQEKQLYRAARNLVKTKVLNPSSLNVYDLLAYQNVYIDQRAIDFFNKHYVRIPS